MQNRDRTATAVYIDDVIETLTVDLATLVSTGRGTSIEAGQIAAQIWELDHAIEHQEHASQPSET